MDVERARSQLWFLKIFSFALMLVASPEFADAAAPENAVAMPAATAFVTDFADISAAAESALVAVIAFDAPASPTPTVPDEMQQFFQKFSAPRDATQSITVAWGFGISADGYIVTSDVVGDHRDHLGIVRGDGTTRPARLVGTDQPSGLALLKVDGVNDQTFLQIDDVATRPGEWSVLLGEPMELDGSPVPAMVAANDRNLLGASGGDFVRLFALATPPSRETGGPVFDAQGKLVGIVAGFANSLIRDDPDAVYATPAAVALPVIEQLKTTGVVRHGSLGVVVDDLTSDIAESLGLSDRRGAFVDKVTAGSAAETAGIQPTDVIVKVDEHAVTSAHDLAMTTGNRAPGTTVNILLVRKGAEVQVKATLASGSAKSTSAPAAISAPDPAPTRIGVTVQPSPDGHGLVVAGVDNDSAGVLAEGDIIRQANGAPVSSVDDLNSAVAAATSHKAILLQVERQSNLGYVAAPIMSGGGN